MKKNGNNIEMSDREFYYIVTFIEDIINLEVDKEQNNSDGIWLEHMYITPETCNHLLNFISMEYDECIEIGANHSAKRIAKVAEKIKKGFQLNNEITDNTF